MSDIIGTPGSDSIILTASPNRYAGGAGADTFSLIFGGQLTAGVSVITDFNTAEGDRLSYGVSPSTLVVFRGAVENAGFKLAAGDIFSSRDYGSEVQQIWTWRSGGDTYVILDKDSSRTLSNADIIVRLSGDMNLDVSVFAPETLSTIVGTDGDDVYVGTKLGGVVYYGRGGNDTIHGTEGIDFLHGGAGDDQIWGDGGPDSMWGGEGNDLIFGSALSFGRKRAGFSGESADYRITRAADGTVRVEDLKGHDGVDTLSNIDRLQFSDRTVALTYIWEPMVETTFKAVLRAPSTDPSQLGSVLAVSDWVVYGQSFSQINREIVKAADATTAMAALSYQFFTGKVPTLAGFDFLIAPDGPNANNLNSAYYARFDTVNRYINFAVNLGKNGEAKESFVAKYGSMTLFDATREAYKTIFGGTPTDAKVHAIIDTRVDYLAYYGGDGATGIGTKAAMVGFLLAAAATEDVGVMSRSSNAWFMDLAADGEAPYAINILDPSNGYYKTDFIFGG